MSTLYDFSCIMFQDSLMPINRSYNGVASLKEAVQNRWADKSGSYFLISSNDAEDQGFDQHGIEWVKVSDFLTGDIIELFIAYEVKESVPEPLGIIWENDPELDHACGNICVACGGPGE